LPFLKYESGVIIFKPERLFSRKGKKSQHHTMTLAIFSSVRLF